MSTLGTVRVHKARLSVSYTKSWRAEVWLESGATAPLGKQTLTLGDLILVGTATRGALDAPDSPHIVHVGGAGWEQPIATPLSYGPQGGATDLPVRLSNVLRDLAVRAGETIEQPADRSLGSTWAFAATRDGAPLLLKDALESLTRDGYVGAWRVDPDGVTRFGPRILGAVAARATPIKRDASVGWVRLGIDSPRSFLPGATFEDVTILRTEIEEVPGHLYANLYTERLSTLNLIERRMTTRFPALTYGYPRTYVVASVRGDKRLDLRPPSESPALPALPAVEQWLPSGMALVPKVGARCLVVFRDARTGTPAVIGFEPGGVPTEVDIDADAINLGTHEARLVREGDIYQLGTATGPITFVMTGGTDTNPTKVKG